MNSDKGFFIKLALLTALWAVSTVAMLFLIPPLFT